MFLVIFVWFLMTLFFPFLHCFAVWCSHSVECSPLLLPISIHGKESTRLQRATISLWCHHGQQCRWYWPSGGLFTRATAASCGTDPEAAGIWPHSATTEKAAGRFQVWQNSWRGSILNSMYLKLLFVDCHVFKKGEHCTLVYMKACLRSFSFLSKLIVFPLTQVKGLSMSSYFCIGEWKNKLKVTPTLNKWQKHCKRVPCPWFRLNHFKIHNTNIWVRRSWIQMLLQVLTLIVF